MQIKVIKFMLAPEIISSFNKLLVLCLLACSLLLSNSFAAIEDYGNLPKIRSLVVSPNGKYTALIQQENGKDVFLVMPTGGQKATAATDLGDIQARNLFFISNEKVILTVSDTKKVRGYSGDRLFSSSYVYDIPSGKIKVLLNKTWGVHPAQGGLGRIVGINTDENRVYMPAYSDELGAPYHLYSVNLDTGLGAIYAKGTEHTYDWFVDSQGNVVAREDYHNKRQEHKVVAYNGASKKTIYANKIPVLDKIIYGKHPERNSLIYMHEAKFYEMSLVDGTTNAISLGSYDADIRSVKMTLNREIVAIEYDGIRPFYELIDQDENDAYAKLDTTFANSRVSFLSSIDGGSKILAFIDGNDSAGSYMLFDTKRVQATELARQYPGISTRDIGEVQTIAYTASDGLRIPTLLTWPSNVDEDQRKKLPMLVFPHGGPESSDALGFDWWAQYFASKGYLIFQPNFRGSSGFGQDHIQAGYGQWGKKMQDDLSDGINALVKAGYADPDRVCIMGGSYGGYAALAGGAFTPELYRCVISVGGISDVAKMLFDDKMLMGKDHFLIRYWEKILGGEEINRQALKEISPINYVSNFVAPTILIHGKADTVVPFKQSRQMYKALKKNNKDSELIELKGEDHWLSKSATRLQMLKEIDRFLQKHNPVQK